MDDIAKYLSNPVWDGISGLIAVVMLVAGVINWLRPNKNQPNPQSSQVDNSYRPSSITVIHQTPPQQPASGFLFPSTTTLLLMSVSALAILFLMLGPPKLNPSQGRPIIGAASELSSINVRNDLALGVYVYTDDAFRGLIEPGTSMSIEVTSPTTNVSYEVLRPTAADGTPFGTEISATYKDVPIGSNLSITNVIGVQHFFYPVVVNTMDVDCTATINEGLPSEYKFSWIIPARSGRLGLGYYELSNWSNVTLRCGSWTEWYGILNGNGEPLMPIIVDGSGYVELYFDGK